MRTPIIIDFDTYEKVIERTGGESCFACGVPLGETEVFLCDWCEDFFYIITKDHN